MKILLISQNSLSLHANNGKTLTGIFSSIDEDCLAQIYFQDEVPESKKFNNFYRIRDIDMFKHKYLFRKKAGSTIQAKITIKNHDEHRSFLLKFLISKLKKIKNLKRYIRNFLYSNNAWFDNDLRNWLKEFDPDLIFLLPSNYSFIFDVTETISKEFNVPMYVYYTDDYLGDPQTSGVYKRKSIRMLNNANGRFVIGEHMAKEYRKRYGKDFTVLSNPVDCNAVQDNLTFIEPSSEINITYAGGLTLGRYDALLKFSNIIKLCGQISNKRINLTVCSGDTLSHSQMRELTSHSIKFLGKLDQIALKELYIKSSFLLHVESDVKEYTRKTKFSVSTKIPECLSTGRGLIAFGPEQLASMKLIYENEIGIFLSTNSSTISSAETLSHKLAHPKDIAQMVRRGKVFAQSHFSQDVVDRNLLTVLKGERT